MRPLAMPQAVCLFILISLTGCGADSPAPTTGGAASPSASGAANAPQASHPLQAELQRYLIERAKKANPQISDQDAQTRMQQQFTAYMQLVAQKCRWSELLDAGQKSGEPSGDVAQFVGAKIEDAMQQMFKTRREFEFEMEWSDDLYAEHAKYGQMSPVRQQLVVAAIKVDAQRLLEKLADPGPPPPAESE